MKRQIFFTRYAYPGMQVAITEIFAAINQAVLAIVPQKCDREYLFHHLSHRKDTIVSTYTQGGQPNLSGDIIRSLVIPLPKTEEQTAIATVLSAMDAEITALERRRDKAKEIKQGMMQQLLTGKVRFIK
jgi:type I restriction enzyme S subunit